MAYDYHGGGGSSVNLDLSLGPPDVDVEAAEQAKSGFVIVENLPDDISDEKLKKMFAKAGSVKGIRTIAAPPTNEGASSRNHPQLYTLIEFETVEMAEKAVKKMNGKYMPYGKTLSVGLFLENTVSPMVCSEVGEAIVEYDDDYEDEDDLAELTRATQGLHLNENVKGRTGSP